MTFRQNLLFTTVLIAMGTATAGFSLADDVPITLASIHINAQTTPVVPGSHTSSDRLETVAFTHPFPAIEKILSPQGSENGKPPQTDITAISRAIESIIGKLFSTGSGFVRKDRDAIVEHYSASHYQPIWIKNGTFSKQAEILIKRLENAEDDGLNSNDYPVYELEQGDDPLSVAAAEVQLTETLLRYARHAQAGRILPSRISPGFKRQPVYPDAGKVVAKLAESDDKIAALMSYHPPQPEFAALRAELVHLRSMPEAEPTVVIPPGKTLYRGVKSNRVAILRERLNVPVLDDENPRYFDKVLTAAVRGFQKEHDLVADGLVGQNTLAFMNGTTSNRVDDLVANMERWRWMPRAMGSTHIRANIPSYNVTIYKGGQNIHRTRVVVGKTKHATPLFSDQLEYVVVNPHWNVPFSIASKELLPRIRSDPRYVAKRNYEVLSGGRVIDPTSVNWNKANFNRIRIRQRPGSGNALGAVKFLFPNKYSVYFHDTPSKSLFQRTTRAFSHGCVRIYKPFEFGNVIMQQAKGWSAGRLRSMVGGKENFIRLAGDEKIEVHLTYFTAVTGNNGKISYKTDVYGYHSRLKTALGFI